MYGRAKKNIVVCSILFDAGLSTSWYSLESYLGRAVYGCICMRSWATARARAPVTMPVTPAWSVQQLALHHVRAWPRAWCALSLHAACAARRW